MALHNTTSFYILGHGLSAWVPEIINPAVRFLIVFWPMYFRPSDQRLCAVASDWLS